MTSLENYVIESVIALFVVAALAVFVLYAARRAGVGRSMGPVELLARLPLEARRSVYVVRVMDQVLIIGSSEAGLAKLGQLPEAAAAELRNAEPPKGFAAVLDAALGRSSSAAANGAGSGPAESRGAAQAGDVP